jgi:hypothetical protein
MSRNYRFTDLARLRYRLRQEFGPGLESWTVSALHDGSTYCALRVCADADADAHAWWLAVRRRRDVPNEAEMVAAASLVVAIVVAI